jgi:hypothetical protein
MFDVCRKSNFMFRKEFLYFPLNLSFKMLEQGFNKPRTLAKCNYNVTDFTWVL